MKYKIKKEFFPFSYFTPPINKNFLSVASFFMKTPNFLFKDKEIETSKYEIESYDKEKIECFLITPKQIKKIDSCLIYIHGGGFILKAAGYHYKNAVNYAKKVGCKVFFINYRLAPKYPHPIFFEDCYFCMDWLYQNREMLKINERKIAIGGDSAGSALAVGVCMMAKDRNHPIKFLFQMLPYPFLDARNNSEACLKYTDTPMWNSRLSAKISTMTKVDKNNDNYKYYSPVESKEFDFFPPTYIEIAEYDCLHDDGILFARFLKESGVDVTLNETKGTMHGFDIVQKSTTTIEAVNSRIKYMNKMFNSK